jgi:uncharacterized protein YbbK (DUF523 family)
MDRTQYADKAKKKIETYQLTARLSDESRSCGSGAITNGKIHNAFLDRAFFLKKNIKKLAQISPSLHGQELWTIQNKI